MPLLDDPGRVLFFTGKGGVGKTSLACATAVGLADRGRRVLLVSTDPASNLDEVLGVALGSHPTAVPGAPGLDALNLDPEAAARVYREQVVAPYRGVLPDTALASIEEQLSGACTVEIAAFNEFARLLGDPDAVVGYDHLLFDTAPTGHTLRLLSLPAAWSGFIAANTTGTSCLGPLAGLVDQRGHYEATLAALQDPAVSTLVLVARPEPSALTEAARASGELAQLGIPHQRLVVNGLFTPTTGTDPVADSLFTRQQSALADLPEQLAVLPRIDLPLLAAAPLGLSALRAAFAPRPSPARVATPTPTVEIEVPETAAFSALVDDLAAPGRGVIMTLGKGGVGKTSIAAAIAVTLARRGHRVGLSTTDPAAHLADAVGPLGLELPGLLVTAIDPAVETAAYTRDVLADAGAGLDAQGRALLEEDLRSPCTEEIAVFRVFARTIAEGQDQFVVLDTAPTGHTLLLLDATEAYHREVQRTLDTAPDDICHLLPRLRDPDYTRALLVTLPEPTPVHEAAALAEDLERAGITPYAWVVNQSLSATRTADPLLTARAAAEIPYIAEAARNAARTVVVPWLPQPPTGPDGLTALLDQQPLSHSAT
jgi:arsenite-transporting ATPase